jgi:hypothetical protein
VYPCIEKVLGESQLYKQFKCTCSHVVPITLVQLKIFHKDICDPQIRLDLIQCGHYCTISINSDVTRNAPLVRTNFFGKITRHAQFVRNRLRSGKWSRISPWRLCESQFSPTETSTIVLPLNSVCFNSNNNFSSQRLGIGHGHAHAQWLAR